MRDDYLQFLTTIYGSVEIEKYQRVLTIAEQVQLEQYQQRFEEIISHADVADISMLRDEWHEASATIVKMVLKALGVIPTPVAEFTVLLDVLEVLLNIEYREDKYGILDIVQDPESENKDKLIQVLEFFSEIDGVEAAINLEIVHSTCIKALTALARRDEEPEADVDTNAKIPPLAKNIRLLINEDPNFFMLKEIKAGLAMGQPVEHYIQLYWEAIGSDDVQKFLRELCAMVLISDTPPHEMLAKLRKIISDRCTDHKVVQSLNNALTETFAPILLQKVDA